MVVKKDSKHVSVKPSEAQSGGVLGFPAGVVVEITEACWTKWEDAGETAIKYDRSAEDPALKIVGTVEGSEDSGVEYLSAGKAARFQPSEDGEYLELAEGSTATAISDSCNANIFLKSCTDTKKHGKMAVNEDLLDDGISAFLVGMKFVTDRVIVKRPGLDDGPDRKVRPTLVAGEILRGPSKKAAGKTEAKPVTKKAVKEEEGESQEGNNVETAEKYVLMALDQPKWKKGIPKKNVFVAVHNLMKDEDADVRQSVGELVQDADFLSENSRPWAFDGTTIERVVD